MNNWTEEGSGLTTKEPNVLVDPSMSNLNNLMSKVARHLREKLFRIKELFVLLILSNMGLNSLVKLSCDIVFGSRLLKCIIFLLKLFIFFIQTSNHGREVTNRVRVKTYTNDHSTDCQKSLSLISNSNISIAYGCDSLERPIDWNDVFHHGRVIFNLLCHNPAVIWIPGYLCNIIPKACHEVCKVEYRGRDLENPQRNVIWCIPFSNELEPE
jgi:hypothetical protein